MRVEPLEWDSQFFERKIGRIVTDKALLSDDVSRITRQGYDTIYLFSKIEQAAVKFMGFPLVDEKVVWLQEVEGISPTSSKEFFRPNAKSPKLLELFYDSGAYSRFKVDPVFASAFHPFYERWLDNALASSYDDHILCTGSLGDPTGVMTLKENEDSLSISIIAIAHSERGRGLGRLFIDKAKSIALEKGFVKLTVATQAANDAAMRFYAGTGFKIASRQFIYHVHS